MLTRIAASVLLLLNAVPFLAAQTCVVPPSGLVSWWPGDVNENDVFGQNNPSSVNAVTLVPAEVNQGFTFGYQGYIQIPQSASLENQTFTLAAWVRPDGPGPVNDMFGSVIINQVTNGHDFLQLSWSAASQAFVFTFGDDAGDFVVSMDAFPAGTFYHVAGTYDGTAYRLFVNGKLEGALNSTSPVSYSNGGWNIGGNISAQENFRTWNGVIDEVQAFNRALSQSELQAIFNAGSAGECKAPSVSTGGVVSASAFGEFTSIAPGTWIEIYGSNLASGTRSWTGADFNGVDAPTSLDNTSVTIGGQAAFIDYISPSQVNALVPSNVAGGTQPLVLTSPGGVTSAVNVTVNPVEPGLLAPSNFDIGGTQYVVAQFADGTYALPTGAIAGLTSRPAVAGDILVIYGIGFGPVTPSNPAGQLVQVANLLASGFQISIGGVQCQVQYDGLAPSYTGLYQFNIVVPDVTSGNQPLTFSVDGVSGTQTLYVEVGQ